MGKTSRDKVNFTQDIVAKLPVIWRQSLPSTLSSGQQMVRMEGTENSLELFPLALTVAAALDLVSHLDEERASQNCWGALLKVALTSSDKDCRDGPQGSGKMNRNLCNLMWNRIAGRTECYARPQQAGFCAACIIPSLWNWSQSALLTSGLRSETGQLF